LLIEWPKGAAEPAKYWLANLAATTPLKELIRTAKLRWRIERDFQELKQELGLNHFEGRSWRGFHHHATLCIAAYGFLVTERCAFSPQALAVAKASACRATSGPAVPRLRPQRHEPTSIATLRIILARLLLRALPHGPYCQRSPANPTAPFL
jgi:Transposase DDE domain